MSAFSIDEQIACVEREIKMREHVYPRFVGQGKMAQEKADREIATMRAVLESLRFLLQIQKMLQGHEEGQKELPL